MKKKKYSDEINEELTEDEIEFFNLEEKLYEKKVIKKSKKAKKGDK